MTVAMGAITVSELRLSGSIEFQRRAGLCNGQIWELQRFDLFVDFRLKGDLDVDDLHGDRSLELGQFAAEQFRGEMRGFLRQPSHIVRKTGFQKEAFQSGSLVDRKSVV